MVRSGRPVFRSALIVAWTREPGDLPIVPGAVPTQGNPPDASTEVVMADRENFAAALLRTWRSSSKNSLIPVLVTGIQPAQVFGRRKFPACDELIHRADARWLDSCDKHRNEGKDAGRHTATEAFPR